MAKRNRGFTQKKYEDWIKEGRGQGMGSDYRPWLTIQDVPSKGRESRIHGIKVDRQHDLLSDNETNYFYILEFCSRVKDIREQYPLLPQEHTLQIAKELGYKHPTDPETQNPIVMTTDFLITVEDGKDFKLLARTIKSKKDFMNKRQIEKFEIEKRYWDIKGIDWGMISDEDIDKTLALNISIVRPFFNLRELDSFENFSDSQVNDLVNTFKRELIGDRICIRESADLFDKRMMLEPGTSLSIFKHLIITKQISINMLEGLNVDITQDIKLKEVRRS